MKGGPGATLRALEISEIFDFAPVCRNLVKIQSLFHLVLDKGVTVLDLWALIRLMGTNSRTINGHTAI